MRSFAFALAVLVSVPLFADDSVDDLDCHEFFIGPPRDRAFATLRRGNDGHLVLEVGTQAMQKDGKAGETKSSRHYVVGSYAVATRHYFDARKKDYVASPQGNDLDVSGVDAKKNVNTARLRYWTGPFKYTNADLTVKEGTHETTTPSMQCRRSP